MLRIFGKSLLHSGCCRFPACPTVAKQTQIESRLISLSTASFSTAVNPPQSSEGQQSQDFTQRGFEQGSDGQDEMLDEYELIHTKKELKERAWLERKWGLKMNLPVYPVLETFREHNSNLPLIKGQMIKGRIIQVQRRVLVIETGWRSYVKFFKSEMNISQVVSCDDNSPRMSNTDFRVGDVMNFRIEEFSVSPYGNMVLGSGEAGPEQRKELVWEELEKCQNEGREVMGRVLNSVNGGYAVGIAGWVTFCPFSAISVTTAGRIGVLQPFVINRMSRQKGNIVVREAQTSEPTYSPYGGYQGNRGPGGFFGGSRRPDDGN